MKAGIKSETQGIWRGHSEAWKASGISQQAYCKQEGISYRSFVYQHTRLMSQTRKAPLQFIAAKPRETSSSNSPSSGIQIMLPNGIRIGISADINPIVLQTVLQVAGAVTC
jgi:hypothetical protein